MKFILNKDKLVDIVKAENEKNPNSGSINYYEAEVEYDESWNGLSIEAILIKKEEEEGTSVAVIDNKVFIDKKLNGRYSIGFVGYTIENNVKTYQISTDLQAINFIKGAGEIEVSNAEDVPTPSEWEIYMAQLQEFMNNANQIIDEANTLDVDADGEILTITKKDGTQKEVNIKGEKGDCNFATFEVNNNMELVMNKTEDMLLEFNLNENGELEVII